MTRTYNTDTIIQELLDDDTLTAQDAAHCLDEVSKWTRRAAYASPAAAIGGGIGGYKAYKEARAKGLKGKKLAKYVAKKAAKGAAVGWGIGVAKGAARSYIKKALGPEED